MTDLDSAVRAAAFEWLTKQTRIHGDVLARELLAKGFVFQGQRIPLVNPQGIFKPRLLPEIPLSISTTPHGDYEDKPGPDGFLEYRYRGTDVNHRDNQGLRAAMKKQVPLIYFLGVVPGRYLAVWPVFIIGDNPGSLTFTIAVDDQAVLGEASLRGSEGIVEETAAVPRRAYITSVVRLRLHQRGFRERVLRAYREQCACCRLRHPELLDAAHIIGDARPEGIPVVPNGIALCKLHHAAFDSNLFGIRPDYSMEVRSDILEEEDGPMLLHGLKGLHDQRIILPSPRRLSPDQDLLEQRYKEFRAA